MEQSRWPRRKKRACSHRVTELYHSKENLTLFCIRPHKCGRGVWRRAVVLRQKLNGPYILFQQGGAAPHGVVQIASPATPWERLETTIARCRGGWGGREEGDVSWSSHSSMGREIVCDGITQGTPFLHDSMVPQRARRTQRVRWGRSGRL